MSKTNKLWHAQHRMPKNPTSEQRVEWHVEHARHCRCRPTPESVLAMLGDRVIAQLALQKNDLALEI